MCGSANYKGIIGWMVAVTACISNDLSCCFTAALLQCSALLGAVPPIYLLIHMYY